MDIFGEIFPLFCWPLGVSTLFLRKGLWFMEKMYIEEKIKDVDRMALFRYLISDRVFVESLSAEDLKKYSKYLKQIYRNKRRENIRIFFNFRKK